MTVSTRHALRPPAPALKPFNTARAAGYALCLMWFMVGGFVLWSMTFGLEHEAFIKYMPRMLNGLGVTLWLVCLSIVMGALLSIPVAMGRLSAWPLIRKVAFGYVYFFRGTPLLAQIFLLYYGAGSPQLQPLLIELGVWPFFREAFNCVLLTFTLNTAAYQGEILKGSIQNVPVGQREAAMSLGLSPTVTFFKIILPQALITALRPLGNEVILMIKGSAIASLVTIYDLMGETKLAFSRTYNLDVYLWAAVLYLALVEALRFSMDRLERGLTRHLRPAGESD